MPSSPTPCPNCSTGHVILKRSRAGKDFYACSRFPSCTFTSTLEPLAEACPSCSASYLSVKIVRKVRWAVCSNPVCPYERRLDPHR